MIRTLNRLIRIWQARTFDSKSVHKLIEELCDLHEEAQQARLIFETEPDIIKHSDSKEIRDRLLDIEYGFCEIKKELEHLANPRNKLTIQRTTR